MDTTEDKATEITLTQEESRSLIQESYMNRLRRLHVLAQDPDLERLEKTMVKRAVYSTFLDCVAMGMAEQARTVLHNDGSPECRALVISEHE